MVGVLPEEAAEVLILLACGVPAYMAATGAGLGDRILDWAEQHGMGHLQPNGLVVGLSLSVFGFGCFAVRRWRQARRNAQAYERTLWDLRKTQAEAVFIRDELARSNLRLVGAIETIPEGVALFDAEDRFVLWNSRYEELYGKCRDLIVAGARFEDVLRQGAERGMYAHAVGRIEEWLAERLELHAHQTGSHEQPLDDGRWLLVQERRLADGGSVGVRIDITDLKRREASHRLLFEANPLPMWVYDLESLRFLAVNDAAVARYGYSRECFLGMTIEQIRPPEDLARLRSDLAAPRISKLQHSSTPWRHRKADGTLIAVEIASHSIDFEGRPAALVVAIDVTASQAAEAELKRARDAAEAGSRAKSEFLANMSHELRTPLNAIIGFSQLIMDQTAGPVPPEHVEYARDINRGGQHLLALVNEILDHAKAESGQMILRPERVSLQHVTAQCVRLVREQAEAARLRLVTELPRESVIALADELRLRQTLLNLLSNAIKFTPPGGRIILTVDSDDGWARIIVADTGVGMNRDDLAKALEPFQQLENHKTRHTQGTGLGLPIAKRLIELQGGRFAIESRPRAGTTVIISLPQEAEDAEPRRAGQALEPA
ncbi:ATP-binding protein [Azospirillum sp. SYSU D00513]|uniref:ATP-binding protein n=1 Tax=Azospirillum sp. SYSU D00513 TaxID=2812561 RepID=UPI001A95E7D5|nr:ATP-binding protein [Azospirillum sp. SYSU D00513]